MHEEYVESSALFFLLLFFPSEFFMPGLVDAHIHAPQYSSAGTRLDLPLLQWLKTYTYPTEIKFRDIDFAEEVYTRAVVSELFPPVMVV